MSEIRYRTLFEAMDEAYAVVEVIPDDEGRWIDFRFLEVNPAFYEHTKLENVIGRTATEILGTPNPRWAEVYGKVAATGVSVRFEEGEMTLDRIFDLYVFRLGGQGSRRVAVLFTNITERRRTEEATRVSEGRLRHVLDGMDEGFCIVEILFDEAQRPVDYRFLEINPAFEQQTGLTDAIGKRMRELEPNHEAYWFEIYGRVAQTGTPERFISRAKYLSDRWYNVYAFPLKVNGQVAIIFNDISKSRQAEQALRRSEARFRELSETLEQRVQERTAQVQALVTALSVAEQEERGRVAQVLHDDLQQLLYSHQMQLQVLYRRLATQPEQASVAAGIQEIKEQMRETIAVTRRLVTELNPPVLEAEGLPGALLWLATHMQQMYGLAVQVEIKDKCEPANYTVRGLLLQMARELLFNIVKHAKVTEARVVLAQVDEWLTIQVTDEGVGFNPAVAEGNRRPRGGYGLYSIAERLKLLGGRLELDAALGQGSRITLTVPCGTPPPVEPLP